MNMKQSSFLMTVTLLLASSFSALVTPAVHATSVQSVDITNRAQVLASYLEEFDRIQPAIEFTGNPSACIPGTTSTAFQNSVLQRVNWYRMMAGLPNVVYSSANYPAAQAGALLASNYFSHTPPPSAKCFSQLGYTGTSSSNLAGGGTGVNAIDMYIDDQGTNNTFVGHRRWILSPELRGIASGDIPRSDTSSPTNALFVFDTQTAVPTRDRGVAWPPPGYVPADVVYDRWSYVLPGANFTNAQVTVTGPNGIVPTTVDSRADWMGAGIVFVPTIPKSQVSENAFTVSISGITGSSTSTITYTTTVFEAPPRFTGVTVFGHRCSGSALYFYPSFTNADYEFKVTWDSSTPDSKNFTFSRSNSGTEVMGMAKSTLDPMRTTYVIPMTATSKTGVARSWNVVVNVPSPKSTTLCAPRTPAIKRIRSGTKVSWQTVPLGARATKFIVKLSPSGKTCSTRSTSCTIAGLKKGTYNVTITASRKGSKTVSTTKRLTVK
jgi:uncharacterized protein YkwD